MPQGCVTTYSSHAAGVWYRLLIECRKSVLQAAHRMPHECVTGCSSHASGVCYRLLIACIRSVLQAAHHMLQKCEICCSSYAACNRTPNFKKHYRAFSITTKNFSRVNLTVSCFAAKCIGAARQF